MKKQRRMEAAGCQYHRGDKDNDDHGSLGKIALLCGQSSEDHQRHYSEFEQKAAGKSRFAERCYYEDENGQRDSYESKADIARPEPADTNVKDRPSSLIRVIPHKKRPWSGPPRASDWAIVDKQGVAVHNFGSL